MKRIIRLAGLSLGIMILLTGCRLPGQFVGQNPFDHQENKAVVKQAKAGARQSSSTASKSSRQSATTSRSAASSSHINTELNKKIRDIVVQTMGTIDGDNSVFVSASPELHAKNYSYHNRSQRAASIIKIFIMITAFAQADAGTVNLSDTYTVNDADKVGGTGVMQSLPVGTELSYRQVMTHMMVDSDNMAANVMIDFLGGLGPINREIQKLGYAGTFLERKLMDTDALAAGKDNMTSVDDLGGALIDIYNGKLISRDADKQMLKIMAQNKNHEKLPAKVTNATEVYNKTGEFAQFGVENDAAIFVGKRHTFVVAVMSQNGHSQEQIQAESDLGEQLATLMLPTA